MSALERATFAGVVVLAALVIVAVVATIVAGVLAIGGAA